MYFYTHTHTHTHTYILNILCIDRLVVELLKPSCTISALWLIILLKEATAIRENCFHERVFMFCNTAEVGGSCQSPIHGWQDPRLPKASLCLRWLAFFP